MADPSPSTKPPAIKGLFASRKGMIWGIVVILVVMGASSFIVLVTRAAWRHEMAIVEAMQMVFGTLITSVVGGVMLAWKLIDAIKDEDVAKVNAAAPPKAPEIAVTGTTTNITQPPPSGGAST